MKINQSLSHFSLKIFDDQLHIYSYENVPPFPSLFTNQSFSFFSCYFFLADLKNRLNCAIYVLEKLKLMILIEFPNKI